MKTVSKAKPATPTRKDSTRNGGSSGKMQSKPPEKLNEFFMDALKDMYWAEKHLVKALAKMQKSATTRQLKDAFADHAEATEEHVARLEKVFEMLGKKAQAKKCEAMEGLTKEAESIIEETEAGTITRDVALIIAAQKVEHYEIATYGGLTQLSKIMGLNEVSEVLGETLGEEKETDELLTDIAENNLNMEAMEGSEDMEEE